MKVAYGVLFRHEKTIIIRVYNPGLSVEINILYISSECLYCGDGGFHIS